MTAFQLRTAEARDDGLGCAFAIILSLPIAVPLWLALFYALGWI